ncbi:3-isopropylmalate dehydratase large subunit [Halomarina halobia]|uniref:3-isopropylmalate dehydratase large subunit n=1 Tax=Halomarina halobia TaxID=3033386 RepID=A0ABD6AEK2_9EURY|nr:3-isopropylmalate dehydratase large subunit [Halomarina sp. PSR21]
MSGTMAEKILASAAGRSAVAPGDHVVCDIDVAMSHDLGTLGVIARLEEMGVNEVWDPSRIVCPMDHVAPSHSIDDANDKRRIREFVERQGIENFYEVGTGIAHEVLHERGHYKPGDLLVGTDSHTTSAGAFGVAGTGLGHTDMAYVYATGQNWFRVPETVKFQIGGTFGEHVTSKDLLLSIAGEHGTGVGQYRSLEFAGSAIEGLPLDGRFTLTNMSIELGAKFGFTPVDAAVTNYIDDRTDGEYDPLRADEDATYRAVHEIDADALRPKIALPHKVGNVVDVDEAAGVELDQVFIGSCTNGKFEDLKAAAEILEGETVDPDTRLIVTPASREIYGRAVREGHVDVFTDAGATTTNATCGACIGMGLGVLGDDEVCLAAMNRNFRGRMGADSSEIYLSSPATAAASAITGRITDPAEV